jgi:hypothetical protein
MNADIKLSKKQKEVSDMAYLLMKRNNTITIIVGKYFLDTVNNIKMIVKESEWMNELERIEYYINQINKGEWDERD